MRCARVGLFGVVLAAVVLPGCLSETPIAPGAASPIDERLVGTWRCVSGDEDEEGTFTLTVVRQSATSYSVSVAESDEKASRFEAFLVGAGENVLANVKDTETESADRWTLARHTLYRSDVLHLQAIDYEKYKAQRKDIPAALKDPKRRDDLFIDWCTCVRVRPKS